MSGQLGKSLKAPGEMVEEKVRESHGRMGQVCQLTLTPYNAQNPLNVRNGLP